MPKEHSTDEDGLPITVAGEAPDRASLIGARVGLHVITAHLGEGRVGAVYAAEHEVLRARRAIKVLFPEWTQSATIVQRFVNEARAASSLRHRSIVEIHDCGQLTGGRWYVIMDQLEGSPLSRFRAAHQGPLSMHVATELLAPIASALDAAHAAGVVHRGLGPENIFLVQRGKNARHPILLDFGIARLGEGDAAALARAGKSVGSPVYLAPEQLRDPWLVDRRSDVYALGVIAYELVTGGWLPYQDLVERDSYRQLSAAAIAQRQLSWELTDPRRHTASLPEQFAAAILAALHPDPARRPPTPRAFALALAEATPAEGALPSGLDLVQTYASELLVRARPPDPAPSPDLDEEPAPPRPQAPAEAGDAPAGTPKLDAKPHGTPQDRADRERGSADSWN
ncbi:MAG TPA: serine/threonine-protein kinase [Kofleriaceae bacterium]|nr:serine/threonine-protein kinase [Kofleriaceae bacterium]